MKRNPYTYNINAIVISMIVWEIIFFVGFYFTYHNFINRPTFRFEYQWVLYGLIAVPLFSLLSAYYKYWQNKAIHKFSNTKNFGLTLPKKSTFNRLLSWFLRRNALAFLIIALSNPQFGKDKMEGVSEGIEIIFALDVSNSMLAQDLSANRSRLSIAKKSITRFVNDLHGDKVGLLIFAGSSYMLTPLTSDYGTLKNTLDNVSPDYISNQGTSIGSAIGNAVSHLDLENGVNKVIVVLSDGEDHDQNAIVAAKSANEKGVTIYTIGMGTVKGGPIPEYRNGRKTGLKKDREGNTVLTKINPQMMTDVAEAGGGSYEQVQGAQINFSGLLSQINEIEKTTVASTSYYNYIDHFYLFLFISMILLVLEQFLPKLFQLAASVAIEGKNE